jgi:hypothetical protein
MKESEVSAAWSRPPDRLDRRHVAEAVLVTNDRTLTLTYDEDAGQVVLEGLPGGPAGEASLSLAEGIELFFDCADGRLAKVLIEAGEPGHPPAIGEPALVAVASLFGARARAAVQRAPSSDGDPLTIAAEPQIVAAMSRLARLDTARSTSSAADSPLWAVEAARLARQAGLATPVDAGARRDGPASAHRRRSRSLAVPDVAATNAQRGRESGASGGLPGWLDPGLIPPGIFRHAVWPDAELMIRTENDGILVEARLVPGADRRLLTRCRARLVDPGQRKVIGAAPFVSLGDTWVQAGIRKRVPPGSAWMEVVEDVARPVSSSQLHHSRRAMRWAQTALTAVRQVCGLADAEWVRLAADAWARCADDWSAARDQDRAYLAAMRRVAICPGAATPEEPSAWAKEVAGRPLLVEEPFLAERLVTRRS